MEYIYLLGVVLGKWKCIESIKFFIIGVYYILDRERDYFMSAMFRFIFIGFFFLEGFWDGGAVKN